jgi:hypothetical protein
VRHAIVNLSKIDWSSRPFSAKICWFGESTIDDRVVMTASLSHSKIPLMAESSEHEGWAKPIGWVSHVEEVDESGVTVLVAHGRLIPDLLPVDGDGNPVRGVAMSLGRIWSVSDQPFVIEHGSIEGLFITGTPAFPEARIRFEQ